VADKANFSYDLFFRGPEGFGEHFQITSESAEDLLKGRSPLINALAIMDAKPLPRDMENQGRSYPARGGPPRPAGAGSPSQKPQPGVTPVCPVDGGHMTMKTGVKGPNTQAPGDPYAFWGCDNYATTGCRGKVNA
jgi:hypothetical protein